MVGAILVGYIPVKVFETIFKTYDLNSSDFQIRYKTIIVDLRTDDPLRYQFTSVFLFRRVLYAGVFVSYSILFSFPKQSTFSQTRIGSKQK